MNIIYTQGTIRAGLDSGTFARPAYMPSPVTHSLIESLFSSIDSALGEETPEGRIINDDLQEKLLYNTDSGEVKVGSRVITPYDDLTDELESVKIFANAIYNNGGKELYDLLHEDEENA